jgi:hypothetical protein
MIGVAHPAPGAATRASERARQSAAIPVSASSDTIRSGHVGRRSDSAEGLAAVDRRGAATTCSAFVVRVEAAVTALEAGRSVACCLGSRRTTRGRTGCRRPAGRFVPREAVSCRDRTGVAGVRRRPRVEVEALGAPAAPAPTPAGAEPRSPSLATGDSTAGEAPVAAGGWAVTAPGGGGAVGAAAGGSRGGRSVSGST